MNQLSHIAFIMDGNRRWARSLNQNSMQGHQQGAQTAFDVMRYVLQSGIRVLSLFAFSRENWQRSLFEVDFVWNLLERECLKNKKFFHENQICFKAIGDRSRWPQGARLAVEELEEETKSYTKLIVVLALDYSGQWDIEQAIEQSIAQNQPNDWKKHLMTQGLPPLDLLVRTGKESRISNYYLYQIAYSELLFLDIFWPEMNEIIFNNVLKNFNERERRFGKNAIRGNEEYVF